MQGNHPKTGRVILHVDMNSFYASVEIAKDPTLEGKPLAIAGNPKERKGIVVTCSYEARKFGVRTTMPVWEAKKLCPQLIVMKPNFERYREASKAMFQLLREYTSLVEPVSIDEGYMDITENYAADRQPEIASEIQMRILSELGLPCSIGVAPNKFLAKMASDMKKPLGITILRKRDIAEQLWGLPVIDMHGIGKKTAEKLEQMGIHTIGELAKADEWLLKQRLGINGGRMKQRANGTDERKVDPDSINEFKSVGHSITLPKDETRQQELLKVLDKLSIKVAARLRNKAVLGTGVSIMIRYKNFQTVTRSKKTMEPVQESKEIYEEAKQLLLRNWNGDGVRLLGVTAQDLVEKSETGKQLNLFSYEAEAKKEPLYQAMDAIRDKYGKEIIRRAARVKMPPKHTENANDTGFNKDFLIQNADE